MTADEPQDALGALEEALAAQLAALRQGRLEDAAALGRRAGDALEEARRSGLEPSPAQAVRIERLYKSLSLAVAQKIDENAARRRHLRRGRKARRSYGADS